jgi:drug/metabolite transporter (DMT)-like permease
VSPIGRGILLAAAAAILFGITTPLVQRFGLGVGPFATAALLYAGAGAVSLAPARARDAPVRAKHLPRLLAMATLGSVLAPMALAWGLQRTSGAAASLVLNMEAVFTVLLARVVFKEPLGVRVGFAVVLIFAGGAALAARAGMTGTTQVLALGAVAVATLGWAIDNTLTRPLADLDPRHVVLVKALTGSLISGGIALLLRERGPSAAAIMGLVACGAVGYGLSLRLYLLAQRTLGAARTGSVFALAPFIGAAVAVAMGDAKEVVPLLAASLAFAAGVYLHATERHAHRHRHTRLVHDHLHDHADAHHDHAHDPPVAGSHSHVHTHEPIEHEHAHAPDTHHLHEHDE